MILFGKTKRMIRKKPSLERLPLNTRVINLHATLMNLSLRLGRALTNRNSVMSTLLPCWENDASQTDKIIRTARLKFSKRKGLSLRKTNRISSLASRGRKLMMTTTIRPSWTQYSLWPYSTQTIWRERKNRPRSNTASSRRARTTILSSFLVRKISLTWRRSTISSLYSTRPTTLDEGFLLQEVLAAWVLKETTQDGKLTNIRATTLNLLSLLTIITENRCSELLHKFSSRTKSLLLWQLLINTSSSPNPLRGSRIQSNLRC